MSGRTDLLFIVILIAIDAASLIVTLILIAREKYLDTCVAQKKREIFCQEEIINIQKETINKLKEAIKDLDDVIGSQREIIDRLIYQANERNKE